MANEYLKIIIEHTEVDFAEVEGFPIKMVFSLDAIEDVQKLSGYYTKRGVLLPATDPVRNVFGLFEEVGVDSDAALEFKEFQIEGNGVPVLWGNCKLRRVDGKDGTYFMVGRNYYVDFLGNNVTWFEDLRSLRLRDLGFGVHDFTEAVISPLVNTTYAASDYGYTVIKMEPWKEDGKILWREHTPFIFMKSFVREVFRAVGYHVVSEFLDYEPIERLIIPIPLQLRYPREFYRKYADVKLYKNALFTTTENADVLLLCENDSTLGNYDEGDNYNPITGEYTVPFAGSYRVDIRFDMFLSVPAENVTGNRIVVFEEGVEVTEDWGQLFFNSDTLLNQNTFSYTYLWDESLVGKKLTFYLRTGTTDAVPVTVNIVGLRIEIEVVRMSINLGAKVDFDWLIPKEWVADKLILGLKHLFNWMIDTKADEGTVYIEPMDRYVIQWKDSAGVDQVIDGEGYFKNGQKVNKDIDFDLSKEMKLVSNDQGFTEYFLEYQTDDETAKGKEKGAGIGLMDAQYLLNTNRHKRGEKHVKNKFFAKTVHLFDMRPMAASSDVVPQFPVIWPFDYLDTDGAWLVDGDGSATDDNDWSMKFARLLYFAGQRGGIDGVVVDENDADYDLPFSFAVNHGDTGTDFSLSFGNEARVDGSEVLGLMHRFYLSMIKRMNTGKRMEGRMFWSEVEIAALSFRNKILVNNNDFLLRRINGWSPVEEKSVRTDLELDGTAESGDEDNVVSSNVKAYFSD